MDERPPKTPLARIARVLQLDRGRIRTLLLAAGVVAGSPTVESLLIGVAIVLPGAALHLWTKGCLRFTGVTTSGPYRFVRNPFYLATLIVDAGICVVAKEPWIAAAYMPLWFVVHLLTIRREENGLDELFGETYEAYRGRVPRLFPWRGRVGGLPWSEGFSWKNPQLAIGIEWARVVRTLASPLVIFAGARIVARRGEFLRAPDAVEIACAAGAVVLLLVDALLVARSRRLKHRAASADAAGTAPTPP